MVWNHTQGQDAVLLVSKGSRTPPKWACTP